MTSARGKAFPVANTALKGSAALWFTVAATGQFIFAAYIALNYGRKALGGNFEAWSDTLIHGIIAGDPVGNIAVGLHLLLALIITLGGPLQLIPAVRKRWPRFHRWNGRAYIVTAFVISLGGLYMVWTRGVLGPMLNAVSISVNALLIMGCAAMALRFALRREFDRHRRWATRLFLVVNGVWFFRVGLMFWVLANGGKPVGLGEELDGPVALILGFAVYLLPLGIYELYLRTQDRAGALGRIGMAAMLVVLTLATAVGIFGATLGMWLPRL